MYPTSFSAYADILLPATEWLETDKYLTCLNNIVVRQEVAHLWETMNETLFWPKLAKRLAEKVTRDCRELSIQKKHAPEPPYWDTMEEICNWHLNKKGLT